MNLPEDIAAAAALIQPWIRETPVERSSALSRTHDADVWLKLENFQVTGSFKARGATHKLCRLTGSERERGVIAASSGNHGAGVAWAARELGISAKVCVPEVATPSKIAKIQSYGTEVIVHGADCVDAEAKAREIAAQESRVYVSPYNDYEVMCGQGTIGAELAHAPEPFDAIFIAMGGGGLIGGVGAYLKSVHADIRVIGCSPTQSPALHECLQAGRVIEVPCHDTFSDATAGGVEAGSITYDVCERVVDESILVSEEEITEAFQSFMGAHSMLIEGAAAVALAGLAKVAEDWRGRRVCVLLCGANIGLQKLTAKLDSAD